MTTTRLGIHVSAPVLSPTQLCTNGIHALLLGYILLQAYHSVQKRKGILFNYIFLYLQMKNFDINLYSSVIL